MAAARSERRKVGFGGVARGVVLVSGGLAVRGATARFWGGAGAEDQHHQSPGGSYSGSRAAEQTPVDDVLNKDGQWGEGGTSGALTSNMSPTHTFNVSIGKI